MTSPLRLLPVLLALVVLGACGSEGEDGGARTFTQKECRYEWENHRQALGENGNPAQEGTVLARRYDEMYAVSAGLAKTATASDCPKRLEDWKNEFDALYELEFAVRQHDMLQQLAIAEGDLRHAVRTRDYDPLPTKLARLFATLRHDAPVAHDDMAAAIDAVQNAELDKESVKRADADLELASRGSAAYARCQEALEQIASYELDEE